MLLSLVAEIPESSSQKIHSHHKTYPAPFSQLTLNKKNRLKKTVKKTKPKVKALAATSIHIIISMSCISMLHDCNSSLDFVIF
jgi:hypothetical protein